MGKEKGKKSFLYWALWIIIVLIVLYFYGNYREKWKEENCDLEFNTYGYTDGCADACSVKWGDNGFQGVSASYFEDINSVYSDDFTKEICVCHCEGCRER